MLRVNRDTLAAIFLLVLCGVFIAATFEIREPDYGQLSPAAWPRVILAALTLLCLLYLVQSLRGTVATQEDARGDESAAPVSGGRGWRNVLWCFGLFFVYLLALPWVGMLVGGTLFVFALLTALGGASPRLMALHAAIAIGSVGGMWLLFAHGLGVFLPTGELTGI